MIIRSMFVNLGHESINQQLKGGIVMKTFRFIGIFGLAGLFAAALVLGSARIAKAASTADPNAASPAPHAGESPSVNTPAQPIPPKFAAVGQGTGQDTFAACPDITCNDSSCVCELGTGTIIGNGVGKSSYSYEISIATGAGQLPSGSFGGNFASQGILTITLPGKAGDTINLNIQGNSADNFDHGFTGFTGFTGSYIVVGGTGKWASARGAGNCSYSQVLGSGQTLMTLNGGLSKK
jgi:hypothetical protein